MKSYTSNIPQWISKLYPNYVWHQSRSEKVVYLTFDDGPIPEVTPWVLQELDKYEAKATFFMLGDNARKHPTLQELVLLKGHAIGNHTYDHLNAWKCSRNNYLEDIEKCKSFVNSSLFRPPYGKVKKGLSKEILKHYTLVMWDVLSGDFDQKITPQKCLDNCIKHIKNGSIIVFHDSLKAEKNLKYVLPQLLSYLHQEGYRFHSICSVVN